MYAYLSVCTRDACSVPRGQAGHQISWRLDYTWLWMLGTEPGSSASSELSILMDCLGRVCSSGIKGVHYLGRATQLVCVLSRVCHTHMCVHAFVQAAMK